MKLVIERLTNPYHNLATEEALFNRSDESEEDIVYLWRNEPSVIIGRNQNTLAEVDMDFAKAKGIHIVRRLTGGGAVYHDLGNINVSYIFSCKPDGEDFDSKYQSFLEQFIVYLQSFDIKAELSGRNDICIPDGTADTGKYRKIAGTAMTQKGNRGIFHLSLLFDVDMDVMEKVLSPSIEKLQSKGITSVRSRCANLKSACPTVQGDSTEEFFQRLCDHYLTSADLYILSDDITSTINDLIDNRYKNDQWTFGRNPMGKFSHSKHFPIGNVELSMEVAKGKISLCQFSGDFLTAKGLDDIGQSLEGIPFDEEQIVAALSEFTIENRLKITDRREFIDFLLGRSI